MSLRRMGQPLWAIHGLCSKSMASKGATWFAQWFVLPPSIRSRVTSRS